MPQYNFEHKWAHKNTDLSHVSLDILFTLYIRNVHHARTQQHHVYVFGAQGRIQKNALFQCRCPHRILFITLLCAFFCAKLNEWIPEIRLPMLVLGTLYLIWLAVKILRSTYDTKAVEPKKGQAYLSGLFLQFVNVKVMVSAIVSIQMFVLPYYQSTEALAAFAIFIAIAGTSCNLIWSGFGSVASRLFANHTKLINTILAISLAFCGAGFWF